MRQYCVFAALVIAVIASPCAALADEPTFADILSNVAAREPRTEAIVRVNSSDAARATGAAKTYNYFEITIAGETAKVAMYNNYLTGKKGETITVPVTPAVRLEHQRLENLAALRKLDEAVADAERRRRIFTASNFTLTEGSDIKDVHREFGEPKSVTHWMRAGWQSLEYPDVSITLGFGKVHDIRVKD